MAFDPDEIVTLHGRKMTLRTAVDRVLSQGMHGPDAAIFREGEPSILDLAQIKQIAASWQ